MSSNLDVSPSTETHRAFHVLPGGGIGGLFTFRLEPGDNGSFVVSFVHDPRRSVHQQDDVGALYYVIAVILIYGCSILMMIASYIRKNKVDRRLNRYLKEMANVRKRERRMTLMTSSSTAAKTRAQSPGQAGQRSVAAGGREQDGARSLLMRSPSPSFNRPPSGQGKSRLRRRAGLRVGNTGEHPGPPSEQGPPTFQKEKYLNFFICLLILSSFPQL